MVENVMPNLHSTRDAIPVNDHKPRDNAEILRMVLSAIDDADDTEQRLYEAYTLHLMSQERYQRLQEDVNQLKWMLLEIMEKMTRDDLEQ